MKLREKFKRRVIELIHGCEWGEAKKFEIEQDCEVRETELHCVKTLNTHTKFTEATVFCLDHNWEGLTYSKKEIFDNFEIIGQPITLSRIMQALDNKYNNSVLQEKGEQVYYNCVCDGRIGTIGSIIRNTGVCWKLLREDGSTATDDDQSDECIEELYKLLNGLNVILMPKREFP